MNSASCFSAIGLPDGSILSLAFRLPLEIDQRLSNFSSSDWEPVQSRVAPPLEESGTGWRGTDRVDGLKSTSDGKLTTCKYWGDGCETGGAVDVEGYDVLMFMGVSVEDGTSSDVGCSCCDRRSRRRD